MMLTLTLIKRSFLTIPSPMYFIFIIVYLENLELTNPEVQYASSDF